MAYYQPRALHLLIIAVEFPETACARRRGNQPPIAFPPGRPSGAESLAERAEDDLADERKVSNSIVLANHRGVFTEDEAQAPVELFRDGLVLAQRATFSKHSTPKNSAQGMTTSI